MTSEMLAIIAALSGKRIPQENEKRAQEEIARVLREAHFATPEHGLLAIPMPEREVRIAGGIIDHLVGTIGIEVKLKGSPGDISRQLRRYAEEPRLAGLVLVTSRPMSLPATINGKPVAVFDLGRAWL